MAEEPAGADRDLLYGILALRAGFLTRQALLDALGAWSADRSRPLADVLVARGALDPARRPDVDRLLRDFLRRRPPAQATATAADADFEVSDPLPALLETIADPDLQESIARVRLPSTEADPAAESPTVADATAAWRQATEAGPPAPPPPDDAPATPPPAVATPPRFRILRAHAVGGLGEVHVAWDEELGREVALKEIRARYADDPRARSRFVREAEVTGNLDHPGVVPVYSLGARADGRPYYAMRFVKGETLQDAIAALHTLRADDPARAPRLRQLLRRFVDICDTIEYAHARGVLHRDLKPANILIGSHGEALIIDWGLAKVLGAPDDHHPGAAHDRPPDDHDPAHAATAVEPMVLHSSLGSAMPTIAGETLGSPPYMSPEQALGHNEELTRATDVYSLGATLYAVLTGEPPVRGSKPPEILARVIRGEITPPLQANPAAPPALAAVCLRAMRLDPTCRYPSARALADDVQRWLDDQPVSVHRDPALTRALRWARRHRPLVAASIALTVATVFGLAAATAVVNVQRGRAVEARRAAEDARAQAEDARAQAEDALGRALAAEETARDVAYNFLDVITLADRQVLTRLRPADRERFLAAGVKFAAVYRDVATADPTTRLRAAEVALRLATLYRVTGRFGEAARLYDDGVALLEGLADAEGADPRHVDRLAEALMERGDAWQTVGRVADAEATFRRAAEIARRNLDAHDATPFRRTLGRALSRLASAGLDLGREDAPDVAARAIEALRPVAGAARPRAEADLALSAADRLELAQALANRAEGLARAGATDEALACSREAFALADRLARQFRGPRRSDIDFNQAWFAIRLARALTDRGTPPDLDEALARLDDAVAKLQTIQAGDDAPALAHRTALADALDARARLRLRRSEFADARADAQTARYQIEPLRRDNPAVVELMALHAEALDALSRAATALDPGARDEARALDAAAIEALDAALAPNPANPVLRRRRADCRARLGGAPPPP